MESRFLVSIMGKEKLTGNAESNLKVGLVHVYPVRAMLFHITEIVIVL